MSQRDNGHYHTSRANTRIWFWCFSPRAMNNEYKQMHVGNLSAIALSPFIRSSALRCNLVVTANDFNVFIVSLCCRVIKRDWLLHVARPDLRRTPLRCKKPLVGEHTRSSQMRRKKTEEKRSLMALTLSQSQQTAARDCLRQHKSIFVGIDSICNQHSSKFFVHVCDVRKHPDCFFVFLFLFFHSTVRFLSRQTAVCCCSRWSLTKGLCCVNRMVQSKLLGGTGTPDYFWSTDLLLLEWDVGHWKYEKNKSI